MIKELKKIISKTIREENKTNKYQKIIKNIPTNTKSVKLEKLSY
jgi:hypothetical protein